MEETTYQLVIRISQPSTVGYGCVHWHIFDMMNRIGIMSHPREVRLWLQSQTILLNIAEIIDQLHLLYIIIYTYMGMGQVIRYPKIMDGFSTSH